MLKALTDNITLLALLVAVAGFGSTEAYYAAFGLSFQVLGLPADHLVHRGLTAVLGAPMLGLTYAAALATVAFQARIAVLLGGVERLRWFDYALVGAFTATAWWAGRHAGISAAEADASASRSSLPIVAKLIPKSDAQTPGIDGAVDGYRLLLQNDSGTYVFKPVADTTRESPLVRFIPSGQLDALSVCARC
ncbi:hypothetical protein [Methylorubrum extorquens]|uniref:hypothetical protein n=1 Tax=Methylorubrum extorquens TaxID=408 RepID=UPI001EE550E4|nr:hypothetical protein [Methylorubrum extorquens]MCG5248434.1 hypothetical protein [Methylorubrum extorquens]